jgi:hypothetical protein
MTNTEQKHFNEVHNSIGLMKNEDALNNYGNHATAIKVLEAHLSAITAANAVSDHFRDGTKMVQPQEAIAWEATTPVYIKYVTDKRYRSFSDAAKRWYKPYKCSSCHPQATEPASCHQTGVCVRSGLAAENHARLIECARRLVEHADFNLGGILSAGSKAKDIPSKAVSQVKSRHLAALRDALPAAPEQKQ